MRTAVLRSERTRIVSVITPVAPRVVDFLGAAYESVAAQDLPPGWAVEWLVQQDGYDGDVAPSLPHGDDRVRLARGRKGGAAIARNMALARATGEVIKVLDADDQLTPGALARDLAVLDRFPEVGWVTSRVLDLLPDGSMVGFDTDPPAGRIAVGDVLHHWRRHDHRLPVHPATLGMRAGVVRMLGGWMALPASEDTGLLLALNAVCTGYLVPDVGLIYRKWAGQATASAEHVDPAERALRIRLIDQRAEGLLRLSNPPVISPNR